MIHADNGTIARTLHMFGSQHRGTILNLARRGTIDFSHPGEFVARQLAEGEHPVIVEVESGHYALNRAGAEVAFHAHDSERGLHAPMHEGWKTNAEARRLGLPTYQAPVVLFWDGEKITELDHAEGGA